MTSNIQILKDVASTTLDTQHGAKGLMSPEQAEHFLDMVFPKLELSSQVRNERRHVIKGEIQKMTVRPRIMRPKKEKEWDGYTTSPDLGSVSYDCKQARVDVDITEEFFQQNIEGQSVEDRVMNLIADQVAVDREDLCLNGDEAYTGSEDALFLTMNDGWIKMIRESGHVVQATGDAVNKFDIDMFYKIRRAVPSKYLNTKFRWIMSPNTKSGWAQYLLRQAATAGGIVTDYALKNPAEYGIITAPSLKDGIILFCDPKNLVAVTTYNIRLRKTDDGVEAMRKDYTAYSMFIEQDAIIEETDATAIYEGFIPFPDEQPEGDAA